MKQILKLSVLISIIFASGCKSDKHMNTDDLKAHSAEKQAKSLTIHNSTRIDNYFWMRFLMKRCIIFKELGLHQP